MPEIDESKTKSLYKTNFINSAFLCQSVVIVKRRERKRENKRWVKTDLENPFKEKEELYEFVEDTQHQATKTIKVILTEDVPGGYLKRQVGISLPLTT